MVHLDVYYFNSATISITITFDHYHFARLIIFRYVCSVISVLLRGIDFIFIVVYVNIVLNLNEGLSVIVFLSSFPLEKNFYDL